MARKKLQQRTEENEPLNAKELETFKVMLEEKRDALLGGSLKSSSSAI